MKKVGLNGYVYHFSVDYDAITVDDVFKKQIFSSEMMFSWLQCI